MGSPSAPSSSSPPKRKGLAECGWGAELQLTSVLQLIDRLRDGACREISASQAATDDFEEQRLEASRNTIWATGCRSWYLDDRGVPAVWPFRYERFREEMAAPDLSAYDLV